MVRNIKYLARVLTNYWKVDTMKNDQNYFIKIIKKQRKKFERIAPSNIVYGSNVLPLLNLYIHLPYDEKMCFLDALKSLLTDSDKKEQDFALDICLGFIVFKDAIK
jgi:hypothetical protein